MPRIKSAKKRVKTSARNQMRNTAQRSSMRTAIKDVRQAETKELALANLPKAFSTIDKAVKRNLIHKNAGARLKSRLVVALEKISA